VRNEGLLATIERYGLEVFDRARRGDSSASPPIHHRFENRIFQEALELGSTH
jgi:hypothetical protein